jgi:GTP-binding protein
MVDAWTELVFSYLQGRTRLRRVFALIDSRHGIMDADIKAMDVLDRAAVNYQIVLTKSDKIKPGALQRVVEDTMTRISRRPAAYPAILKTSSEKSIGIAEVRAEIYNLSLW